MVNKTQQSLLDNYNSPKFEITEQRLQELQEQIEAGEEPKLSLDEERLFQDYVKQQTELWQPWWLSRDQICVAIQETSPLQDINLNLFTDGDIEDAMTTVDLELDDFRAHYIKRFT